MAWRKKSAGELPGAAPSSHGEGEKKVPRGHLPVVTDCGQRVLIPVSLLRDPCVAELLDMAAEQYGYGQPGVLQIPCDASHFQRVLDGALQRGA